MPVLSSQRCLRATITKRTQFLSGYGLRRATARFLPRNGRPRKKPRNDGSRNGAGVGLTSWADFATPHRAVFHISERPPCFLFSGVKLFKYLPSLLYRCKCPMIRSIGSCVPQTLQQLFASFWRGVIDRAIAPKRSRVTWVVLSAPQIAFGSDDKHCFYIPTLAYNKICNFHFVFSNLFVCDPSL